MDRVQVDGAQLEVEVRGSGEPVLVIPTALTADEFVPLIGQPPLREQFRLVHYRRRGYGGSSPAGGPGSIPRDAADAAQLLAALGIPRAHVLGGSYSAAVALQLARDRPACVHTLTLLEPPPAHVPSAAQFRAASAEFLEQYRDSGAVTALDRFLTRIIGADWRGAIERSLPNGVAQVERDAPTFFEADIPALLAWQFGPADAEQITAPVLHIGGSESGPLFAEVRQLVLTWLPHAEDVVLPGADHSMALTHPAAVAAALVDFLHRHPIERP